MASRPRASCSRSRGRGRCCHEEPTRIKTRRGEPCARRGDRRAGRGERMSEPHDSRLTILSPRDVLETIRVAPHATTTIVDPWYNKGVGGESPDTSRGFAV